MQRCSVCRTTLVAEAAEFCDGEMESCHKVCARLHIGDHRGALFVCTGCYIWLIGAYNDLLTGRPFDGRAVRFLRLMRVDQEPVLRRAPLGRPGRA
jgi:hypothetical protein